MSSRTRHTTGTGSNKTKKNPSTICYTSETSGIIPNIVLGQSTGGSKSRCAWHPTSSCNKNSYLRFEKSSFKGFANRVPNPCQIDDKSTLRPLECHIPSLGCPKGILSDGDPARNKTQFIKTSAAKPNNGHLQNTDTLKDDCTAMVGRPCRPRQNKST